MKALALAIAVLIALPCAAQVTLTWEPVTDAAGYKLYHGTESNVYGYVVDVGSTTNYSYTGLVGGYTYYFSGSSYDSAGFEGSLSAEVSYIPTIWGVYASAYPGGTISPSGLTSVTNGGSQTYEITPNSGYKIRFIEVDGKRIYSRNTYTFSNVTANHVITAYFRR